VSEQKYRQHGYQDRGRDKDEARQKQSSDRPVKKETFGPRALQMPGTHTVSRCAQCGALLASTSEPIGKCPKCGFELHSCRQCTYFDTSSRFECAQPIPERIARKDERNECRFYSMRVRVEKETSTPSSARPMDARTAFENLFKK
jgi:phage FluMu protein Com